MQAEPEKHPCTATTARGRPCTMEAREGSDPPLCYIHRPRQGPPPGKTSCSATATTGKPCRRWAPLESEPPLCTWHAGPAGRRAGDGRAARIFCTATRSDWKPCRGFALRGSDPPLCARHAPGGGLPASAGNSLAEKRRCIAITSKGKRCLKWTMRNVADDDDWRLCEIHAGRGRLPDPGHRRCVAKTVAGRRCRLWAIQGSDPPLCTSHMGWGKPLKSDRKRCTALTQDGQRCRRYATTPRDHGITGSLCWLHAHPSRHPRLRHGYYRITSSFSPEELAAIDHLVENGRPLDPEILMVRLQIRALLDYLDRSDLSVDESINMLTLIFRGSATVARLIKTQIELLRQDRDRDRLAVFLDNLADTLESE